MYDTYLNKFRAHQEQITDHAALNMRIGNPKRCADDANTGKRRQPAASCSCSVQLQHMGETEGAKETGRRPADRRATRVQSMLLEVAYYDQGQGAQEEQCVAWQITSSCVDLGLMVCQDQSCPNSERLVY